jgi:hypothetical protein
MRISKIPCYTARKELTKFKDLKVDDGGESLNVSRGRSKNKGRGRSTGPSLDQRVGATSQSSNVIIATS